MKHNYTDDELLEAFEKSEPLKLGVYKGLRAFLDALPERLQAQPGPWPGQQEAIDAAFQQIDEFYLDYKSSHDDWEHEAPARLAIAQAYDKARPQAAEIASLKAEREKWEADALRYCKNADFWRSEHDKAQAELAALRQPLLADDGRSLEAVFVDAFNAHWQANQKPGGRMAGIQAVAAVVLAQAVRRMEAVPVVEVAGIIRKAWLERGAWIDPAAADIRARFISAAKGEGQQPIKGLEGLTKERCLRIAEIEGDSTVAAGPPILADDDGRSLEQVAIQEHEKAPLGIKWFAAANAVAAVAITRAVQRIEAVTEKELQNQYWKGQTYVGTSQAIERIRARLIAAAKGEGQPVVVNKPPKSEEQPDLCGESEKQDLGAMVKAAREAAIKGLTGPAWIPHDGGPCPFKDEEVAVFEVFWSDGRTSRLNSPSIWPWNHRGGCGDILKYRVLRWKPGHGPQAKAEPATFEAHGKVWTRHTPGDPMPCDGDAEIDYMMRDHGTCSDLARTLRWAAAKEHESRDADIIGWRYADEPAQPWTPDNAKAYEDFQAELRETWAAQPWTPTVGDTVRLKSGGPIMTVHHISKDGSIACTHNANGEFEFVTLPAACLTPVQNP